MVGCSRPSCTYRFFFGVNISNAVHPTLNLIGIRELWHNQTQTNKMLNWTVPVSTGGYCSFLYLLFYFPITSSIKRRKENSIRIQNSRNSLIPFGRSASYNYLWLFMSLAWPLAKMCKNVEGSGINGRYYWKDSPLDNRNCNWYSCDRFNRHFLLWFIFRIRFVLVVIEWTAL